MSEQASSSNERVPEEYYGIQIMSLGRLLEAKDPALSGLSARPLRAEGASIYKYIYGTYSTQKSAADALSEVRRKFPQAFVVKVQGTKVEPVK